MRHLPRTLAFEIYKEQYYKAPGFNLINDDTLVHELTDTGVNMGPATATKFVQKAFNACNLHNKYGQDLAIDGKLGPKSIAAINSYTWPHRLANYCNILQGAKYLDIASSKASQRVFTWGWLNERVFKQFKL